MLPTTHSPAGDGYRSVSKRYLPAMCMCEHTDWEVFDNEPTTLFSPVGKPTTLKILESWSISCKKDRCVVCVCGGGGGGLIILDSWPVSCPLPPHLVPSCPGRATPPTHPSSVYPAPCPLTLMPGKSGLAMVIS